MGIGKTEAALFAAYLLISRGFNSGLYFGLPTRLTSERIHNRVSDYLREATDGTERARLIHGQAWLKEFFHGAGEFRPKGAWFLPRKRALLQPYGVGTIDQALLSVMRVKHHFLRSFGLAGKVVILDEVHSYDVYTGTLLDELVASLLAMNCSVIILSATLTKQRKASFLPTGRAISRESYPLITFSGRDGALSEQEAPPPPEKPVLVSFTPMDYPAIAKVATEHARKGQCVLWIANTVADSQEAYRAVKGEMFEHEFPVGLLHSRFPVYRREELENEWMELLGKGSTAPTAACCWLPRWSNRAWISTPIS